MSAQTILLVDDESNDIELARYALRPSKLTQQLVVVGDGVEAWHYLQAQLAASHSGPVRLPALILLDMNMGRLNGLELLQRIRADARLKLVPVVFLTSSAEPQEVSNGYRWGPTVTCASQLISSSSPKPPGSSAAIGWS